MFADWCPKSVNSIWLQTSVGACSAHCCQGAKASFLAPRWRNKGDYYHRLGCPAIGWQGTLLELWPIPNRATKSRVRGAATKSGSWGGYLLQTQRYSAVWYTHENNMVPDPNHPRTWAYPSAKAKTLQLGTQVLQKVLVGAQGTQMGIMWKTSEALDDGNLGVRIAYLSGCWKLFGAPLVVHWWQSSLAIWPWFQPQHVIEQSRQKQHHDFFLSFWLHPKTSLADISIQSLPVIFSQNVKLDKNTGCSPVSKRHVYLPTSMRNWCLRWSSGRLLGVGLSSPRFYPPSLLHICFSLTPSCHRGSHPVGHTLQTFLMFFCCLNAAKFTLD